MMTTKNITICVPKDILKLLDEYHQKAMVPKSKLISKLLEEFFEKNDGKFKMI